MKNKYLSVIFGTACILSTNFLNIKTSAFLGNAHYYMSEQVLEKFQKENNIELSNEEKNSFKSGSVMAHIGRFDMDNENIINPETNKTRYIISRSEEFADQLLAQAKINNNKIDIWFALGACIHCEQDNRVSSVLNSLENFKNSEKLDDFKKYYLKCGAVEDYFYDKLSRNINCEDLNKNFDLKQIGKDILEEKQLEEYASYAPLFFMIHFWGINSDNLLLNEDLLINTYKNLGLEVTKENIQKQAANLVGASAILTYLSRNFTKEPPPIETDNDSEDTIIENIELESEEDLQENTNNTKNSKLEESINNLVDLCVEKLKNLTTNIDFEKLN